MPKPMIKLARLTTLLLATCLALPACQRQDSENADIEKALAKRPSSWLITNITVIDGSGAPAIEASVRIDENTIIEVGQLSPLPGEAEIDGNGQVLAPGFIDTHSHADRDIFDMPDALSAVSQGITTILGGQDGSSPFPIQDFIKQFEEQPAAVNFATYVGHNTLRRKV